MNNSSAVFFGFRPEFSYPVAACYIVITVLAVFGNFLVCFAILANRHLRRNPKNLFIFSLALSDFLAPTIVVPFDIESLFLDGAWNHGRAFCIVWQVVYLSTVPISTFSLLTITVDRYKTLSDPLSRFKKSQFMTQTRARIVIAIIWLYCPLWPFFVLMGWREEGEADDDGICILPYTKNGTFPWMRQPSKDEKKVYFRNIKAAKTTSKFVLALLFWQPYFYFVIASAIDSENWESFPHEVYLVLLMFGYLNSALNPFLFAFSNKSFKAVYKKRKPAVKRAEPCTLFPRLSTFSQSTVTSDIPELGSGVRLRSISYYEDSVFESVPAAERITIGILRDAKKRGMMTERREAGINSIDMYLKNIKAAKRSSVFVLAIFVCWLPYALWLVSDIISSKKWTSFDHEVYIVLLMFGFLNSALNPFLFVFRKKNFRAVYAKRLKHRSYLSI
ncbi:histamine H2 receptor-like [Pocillopora verrucosa]|uniref:histamine H2 receptor-like n=1 Tax=Pocillopora verrucosa TaxID=203993 RepID=UPI003341433F